MDVDKYSVLFQPSTPRASPTLAPIPLPTASTSPSISPNSGNSSISATATSTQPLRSGRRSRPSSIASASSSEFGSFVGVPADQDPLSAISDTSFVDGTTPTTATASGVGAGGGRRGDETPLASASVPSSDLPSVPPSSHHSTTSATTGTNASLDFFESFTHDAQKRSSAARSHMLDELLSHQDDPMWFTKNASNGEQLADQPASNLEPTSPPPPLPPPKSPILDLDHDYFRPPNSRVQPDRDQAHSRPPSPKPASSTNILLPPDSDSRSRPASRTRSTSRSGSASRSGSHSRPDSIFKSGHARYASSPIVQRAPSLPLQTPPPPSLAPPVASRWTASPPRAGASSGPEAQEGVVGATAVAENLLEFDPLAPTSTSTSDSTGVATEYGSLSAARPALESIISSDNIGIQRQMSSSSPHLPMHPSYQSQSEPPPPTHFASSAITHVPSPFAAQSDRNTYIAPSGAPGFRGESSYDWDKGYSDSLQSGLVEERLELEREQRVKEEKESRLRDTKVKVLPSASSSGSRSGTPTPISVSSSERTLGSDLQTATRSRSGSTGASRSFGGGRPHMGGSGGIGSWYSPRDLGAPTGRPSPVPIPTSNKPSGDHSAKSGGGWGSSFSFGFGSVRGSKKAKSSAPPPPPGQIQSARIYDGPNYSSSLNRSNPSLPTHGQRQLPHSTGSGMGDFMDRMAGNVELLGRREATAGILGKELAGVIRSHLPALSRLPRSWTLIYSFDQHGISLNTLYSKCESYLAKKPGAGEVVGVRRGMLVVVQESEASDEEGDLFGAWIAEGIQPNKGKGYAGGGESFLWKNSKGKFTAFKTTGKNSYVALCEPDFVGFGGGDGHYGLYLDDTLFEGSSAPCPTFDNDVLCSLPASGTTTPGTATRRNVNFECVGLEVWGMGG